jgi:LacI family transcriptional regulator
MRRSNATTLKDVAADAGVTVMAASVVLNGATSSARVSEATRARIVEAAERLRYRRNAVAWGLSQKRMNTIGVATTITSRTVNLYYVEVLTGILSMAAERGQNTTIFAIRNWQEDEQRLIDLCDGKIDGMILIGPQLSPNVEAALIQHTPLVALHGNGHANRIPNLTVDDVAGSYTITRHLLDLGHRRFAHLAGRLESSAGGQRYRGFRRAVEEAGLSIDDQIVLSGEFLSESGYERTIGLLDDCDAAQLPTAIVCGNDAIAFGCVEALSLRGLRVPDDISVVGFDDTLIARVTRPTLTTVHQPLREMSWRAVDMLLSHIESDRESMKADSKDSHEVHAFEEEIFPTSLVIGESSAAPRRP